MAVLREYRNEDTYFPEGTFCVYPKVGQEPLVLRKLFEHRTVSVSEKQALIYDNYDFRFVKVTIHAYVDFNPMLFGFSSLKDLRLRVERRKLLLDLRRKRHIDFIEAKKYNLSRDSLYKLYKLSARFADQELKIVLSLLGTKEFKSTFRKECSIKIREWINNTIEHYPLTQNEFFKLGSYAIARNRLSKRIEQRNL